MIITYYFTNAVNRNDIIKRRLMAVLSDVPHELKIYKKMYDSKLLQHIMNIVYDNIYSASNIINYEYMNSVVDRNTTYDSINDEIVYFIDLFGESLNKHKPHCNPL